MNTKHFVTQLNSLEFRAGLTDVSKVHREVDGFSAPYLMKVLNLAISNMEPREYYLEIGSHRGRTLIGGMIGNADKRAVAVDNFSQFGEGSRKALLTNIEKFGLGARIDFYERDSDDFFENVIQFKFGTVGVYMYDGNHDTDIGFENLCNVVPYLSGEAVIILDDFSSHGVWRSIQQFMARYATETALLFCMRTNDFPVPDSKWWNGVVAISWKANRDPITGV